MKKNPDKEILYTMPSGEVVMMPPIPRNNITLTLSENAARIASGALLRAYKDAKRDILACKGRGLPATAYLAETCASEYKDALTNIRRELKLLERKIAHKTFGQ